MEGGGWCCGAGFSGDGGCRRGEEYLRLWRLVMAEGREGKEGVCWPEEVSGREAREWKKKRGRGLRLPPTGLAAQPLTGEKERFRFF